MIRPCVSGGTSSESFSFLLKKKFKTKIRPTPLSYSSVTDLPSCVQQPPFLFYSVCQSTETHVSRCVESPSVLDQNTSWVIVKIPPVKNFTQCSLSVFLRRRERRREQRLNKRVDENQRRKNNTLQVWKTYVRKDQETCNYSV